MTPNPPETEEWEQVHTLPVNKPPLPIHDHSYAMAESGERPSEAEYA